MEVTVWTLPRVSTFISGSQQLNWAMRRWSDLLDAIVQPFDSCGTRSQVQWDLDHCLTHLETVLPSQHTCMQTMHLLCEEEINSVLSGWRNLSQLLSKPGNSVATTMPGLELYLCILMSNTNGCSPNVMHTEGDCPPWLSSDMGWSQVVPASCTWAWGWQRPPRFPPGCRLHHLDRNAPRWKIHASPAACLLFPLGSSFLPMRRVDPPLPQALPGEPSSAVLGLQHWGAADKESSWGLTAHVFPGLSQAEQRVKISWGISLWAMERTKKTETSLNLNWRTPFFCQATRFLNQLGPCFTVSHRRL